MPRAARRRDVLNHPGWASTAKNCEWTREARQQQVSPRIAMVAIFLQWLPLHSYAHVCIVVGTLRARCWRGFGLEWGARRDQWQILRSFSTNYNSGRVAWWRMAEGIRNERSVVFCSEFGPRGMGYCTGHGGTKHLCRSVELKSFHS